MTWLFVLALHLAPGPSCQDLCSRDAVRGYSSLLMRSNFGRGVERAAWVVKESDGRLRFVWWSSAEDLRATFVGIIPGHTIAIAHTHPADDIYPSRNDVAEAQRIRVAVLVITPDALTIARSDGTVATLERGSEWRSRRQ